MKSNRLILVDGYVSEPRVLHCNAGHYIGYECWDYDRNCWEPWSRVTAYMGPVEAHCMLVEYIVPDCISKTEEHAVREYWTHGLHSFAITAISRGYFDE